MSGRLLSQGIDISASGTNQILVGVVDQFIEVYGLSIVSTGSCQVGILSGTNTLSGAIEISIPYDLPPSDGPWFSCNSGEDLIFSLSESVQVGGFLLYRRRQSFVDFL